MYSFSCHPTGDGPKSACCWLSTGRAQWVVASPTMLRQKKESKRKALGSSSGMGCLLRRLKALGLISNTQKRRRRREEEETGEGEGKEILIYNTHVHFNDFLNHGYTVLLPIHV